MNSALLRTVAKSAVRVPKVNVQPIRKMGGDGHDHVHVSWRSWTGQATLRTPRVIALATPRLYGWTALVGGDSGCELYALRVPAASVLPPDCCSPTP